MRNGRFSIGRTAMATVLAIAAGICAAPVKAAESIEVEMDSARLLKVPEGTDTIIVGNPLIADVAVQRNNVMVLTGKLFGSTNMIALDNKGAIISESRIIVSAPQADRLIVMRGGEQETYSCSPTCGPVLQVGDSDKNFNKAATQSSNRLSAIKSAGVDRP